MARIKRNQLRSKEREWREERTRDITNYVLRCLILITIPVKSKRYICCYRQKKKRVFA